MTPPTAPIRKHSVHPAALMAPAILLAAAAHAYIALKTPSPWIVPDELIYSELAKSLGEGGVPTIRDEVSLSWGLGYPLLLAPVWAMFEDVESAYAAARVLNAVLMALTAIPVYALARRFTLPRYSFVAALLSITVPFLLYSGTLMTEVALYPAVAVALLAMTVAVEKGGAGWQLAAFAAIAVACLIKALAAVLLVSYVLAIVAHWWLGRAGAEPRPSLARYRVTWAALLGCLCVLLLLGFVSGESPTGVLGTYETVVEQLRPSTIPGWVAAHSGELVVAVAVIPIAATLTVWWRGVTRQSGPKERLFLAVSAPVVFCWLLAVGTYASVPFLESFEYPENVERLQGRSTFMLAIPLLVGFAMWLEDQRASRTVVVAAALTTIVLPSLIPFDRVDENARFQTLPLVPWLDVDLGYARTIGVVAFTAALVVVFALVARTRFSGSMAVLAVALVFMAVSLIAQRSMMRAGEWTRSAAATGSATWIDDAVGPRAEVTVLWAEPPNKKFTALEKDQRQLFIGEFFNRSIGTVYEVGSPLPYGLPAVPVRVEDGRVLLTSGRPAPLGEFVLAPCNVTLHGVRVAYDSGTGASVYRVAEPITATVRDPSSCGSGQQ